MRHDELSTGLVRESGGATAAARIGGGGDNHEEVELERDIVGGWRHVGVGLWGGCFL